MKLWITVALGVGTTVWFLIGGVIDVREMFRLLRAARRDDTDDGEAPAPAANGASEEKEDSRYARV